MKKLYFSFFYYRFLPFAFCLFTFYLASAQTPNKINYQAVARNAGGTPIVGASIYVRFAIHQGSAGGTVVWQEDHNSVTTNNFGLFNLEIGGGINSGGSLPAFADIPWGSNFFWLEIFIDPDAAGGSGYTSMGSTQLISVPYAMHAHTADSLKNGTGNLWKKAGNSVTLKTAGDSVGIGTNSPGGKLEILKSTPTGKAGVFQINNASNPAEALFAGTNGTGTSIFGINVGSGSAGIFQINNASNANSVFRASTNGLGRAAEFSITNGTSTSPALHATTSGTAGMLLQLGNDNQPTREWIFKVDGSANLSLFNENNGSPFTSMQISNAGDMTIGAFSAPLKKLSVEGSLAIVDANGSFHSVFKGDFQGDDIFYTLPPSQAVGTSVLQNDGSGNLSWGSPASSPWTGSGTFIYPNTLTDFIGIGTNGPLVPLHIQATVAEQLIESTSGSTLKFSATSNPASMGTSTNHPLGFTTDNTVRMTIDAAGNVGIGTPSPGVKLDVAGDIRGTNTTSSFISSYASAPSSTSYFDLVAHNAGGSPVEWRIINEGVSGNLNFWVGANRMTIEAAGNVGIGTSSAPLAKLHINDGHIKSSINTNSPPTIGASAGLGGVSILGGSTDTKGTVQTSGSLVSNTTGSFQINFGQAYNSPPVVVVTAVGTGAEFLNCAVSGTGTGSVTVNVYNTASSGSVNAPSFNYIVIE